MNRESVHPIRQTAALLLLALTLITPSVSAQRPDPAQIRSQIAQLQQDERNLLDEQAFYQDYLRPEIVLLTPLAGPPVGLPLDVYTLQLLRWKMAGRLQLPSDVATLSDFIAEALRFSNQIKEGIQRDVLPDLARQLERVRQAQATANQQLSQVGRPSLPAETPGPGPAVNGEGWVLERMIGSPGDNPRAEVLSSSATPSGGDVTMRYKTSATCSETWRMSWKFDPDLSFVREGMRIQMTLTTALVGRGCNFRLGSYLTVGTGPTEKFVFAQIPADRLEPSIFEEPAPIRAEANSALPPTSVTLTSELVVRRQPARWPSFVALRLYSYVPQTTFVTAYLFRAN